MDARPQQFSLEWLLAQGYRFWQWVIEPGSRVQDPDARRRARLLACLLLPYIPSFLIMKKWAWYSAEFATFVTVCTTLLCAAYVVNRRGNYAIAATISAATASLLPFVLFLTQPSHTAPGATTTLVWTATALVVGYLLFGLRGTVLTFLGNIAGILLIPHLVPELSFNDILYVTYFNMVVGCEVMIAALVRHYDRKRLSTQAGALQESEERYRDLFHATIEGILVHNNGVILDANAAFEAILGYTLPEIIGTSALQFFDEAYRQVAAANLHLTKPYEARCRRKDGKMLWVEIQGKSQTYRGKHVRIVSIRDITERKQSEAQQFELAVEREKVIVLQRFIGDMSHDLRTPLSVIKTSLYLLERLAHDPDKFKQNLDMLRVQTDHLQGILDDLLSMSRLDKADTSDYRFRWLDINAPIKEAVEEQQTLALRKHILLTCYPAASPARALIDYNEFKRMIKHLILNGLNYTPEGGSVKVQIRDDEQNIMIDVSDTGEGITPLDLPHIFDRFYRADQARSGESGGTGLGLTIARKIVEAHSGTIEAESEFGHGSIFRVIIPKIVANEAVHSPIMPSESI